MNHWAIDYIGRPWVCGGLGPDEFDCWGFVRYIKKHHFDEDVPVLDVNALNLRSVLKTFRESPEFDRHELVDKPRHGDIVVLRHSKNPTHCGIWIDVDGGAVLHCVRNAGVVFQSLDSLKKTGWSGLAFYRLKDEFK